MPPKNKKENFWTRLETSQKRLAIIGGIFLAVIGIFGSLKTIRDSVIDIIHPKYNEGELKITDIIPHSLGRGKYELDFRIENSGNATISISKVIFICKGIYGTMSGMGSSSENEIPLDISNLQIGKQTEGDLAIQVKSKEVDRFKVVLSSSWTDNGKTMMLNSQLKTNYGLIEYNKVVEINLTKWSDVELSLAEAIEEGNIPIVESILKDDSTYSKIINESELVDDVCGNNQKDVLKLLLNRLGLKNKNLFEKGLLTAIDLNKPEIVEILLDNGVSPNANYKMTPESWIAVANDIINKKFPFQSDKIKPYVYNNIISGRSSHIERDSIGISALQMANYYGNQKIINLLLIHKANENFRDKNGKTPMDYSKMKHTLI